MIDSQITLLGGWGYDNLGDEAILAGYISWLRERASTRVISVDPKRTDHAQGSRGAHVDFRSEFLPIGRSDVSMICGGGYWNGNWRTELVPKLIRFGVSTRNASRLIHGVELRALSGMAASTLSRRLLGSGPVAVRDQESWKVANELGCHADVLGDSISLLYPYRESYVEECPLPRGKILVNFQDLGRRPDRHDATGLDLSQWRSECARLVAELGDQAVGLVLGDEDRIFMSRFPGLDLIQPKTVTSLLSILASAAGLISVRMHPALIASMFGVRTAVIPYNGKIVPTLRRLGLDGLILTEFKLRATMSAIDHDLPVDAHASWSRAFAENDVWLREALAASVAGEKWK